VNPKLLILKALRELERVRVFAERSEEQRGEVVMAAKVNPDS
jgi:hypothetical protein